MIRANTYVKGLLERKSRQWNRVLKFRKYNPPERKDKTFNYLLKGHAGYLGKTSQNNTL